MTSRTTSHGDEHAGPTGAGARLGRGLVSFTTLLAALVSAPPAAAQDGPSEEALATFAWLEKLDLPTRRGAPFVCVRFPGTTELLLGFLVGESKDTHEILTVNLELRRVAKSSGTMLPYSLDKYAKNVLGELRLGWSPRFGGLPKPPPDVIATATTAHACWLSGLTQLAGEIWGAAGGASCDWPRNTVRASMHAGVAYEQLVARELATSWLDEIVATLRDPSRPLVDALACCTRYQKALPGHPPSEQVSALAKGLRAAIGRSAGAGADSRSIEALLDRLVEQPADLASADGPAARIEQLGFAAVPGLLARLQDELPTRAIALEGELPARRFRVTTVGHHAFALLVRIAGGSLALRPGRELTRAAAAGDPASAARAWWTHAQPLGQLAYRVAATRAGDVQNAHLLVAESPAEAQAPLLDSLSQHASGPERAELVVLLGRVPGARDWLAAALDRETAAACRAAAAAALLEHGDPRGAPALMEQWRAVLAAPAFDAAAATVLVRALAASTDPAARIALCDAPATLPAAFHSQVLLEALTRRPWPETGDERAALRGLFLRALDDWRGVDKKLELDGVPCEFPRVRDVAAQMLRRVEPAARGFRFDATSTERVLLIRDLLARLRG